MSDPVSVSPVTRFQPGQSGNPAGRPRKTEQKRADAMYTDGWYNLLTGMGVSGKDKRKGGLWCVDVMSFDQSRDIWRGSALADRMVSIWPEEMTREGFTMCSDDPKIDTAVKARWEDLEFIPSLLKAMQYARAYGGGAILLGVNDGNDMSEPLDMDGIISLDFLTPLEARELIPFYWYNDPNKAKYRKPEVYQMISSSLGQSKDGKPATITVNALIHESRMVIFDGIRVTEQHLGSNQGWGDSIFVRGNSVIDDFEAACASLGILITDFSTPVYKMSGLVGMVAAQGAEAGAKFITRMRAMEMGRSVANARLIDKDDEFERKTTVVSGLGDLWDRMMTQLAMVADIPVTRLMGISPAGLNATGESDIRGFYDRVGSKRISVLKTPVERVIKIIIRALGFKEPESWSVEFGKLWQETPKEQAEIESLEAATAEKYYMMGVLDKKHIQDRLNKNGTYSIEVEEYDTPEVTSEEKATLRDPTGGQTVPPGQPITPGAVGGDVQKSAMNGTQVTSLVDVIKAVANEEISRESGIAILMIAFQVSDKEANTLLGPETFKPKKEDPPMAGGFGKPPEMGGQVPPVVKKEAE